MVQEVPKKNVFVNKMTLDVFSSLIQVSRQKNQSYNSVQSNTTVEAIKWLRYYMQRQQARENECENSCLAETNRREVFQTNHKSYQWETYRI